MVRTIVAGVSLCLASLPAGSSMRVTAPPSPKLRIEEVGSDSTAFHVVAVLVIGPTEAIAWDAQYHLSDANRLADRIQASGSRLKAIVISHPDEDHFMGAARLVERFPGTPVYMTPAAIELYKKVGPQMLRTEKARRPGDTVDSLVTAQPLPAMRMTVDGEVVEVIPDLSGDVLQPTNSALWIPSLRTVLAGDVAFNGVHPWLGSADEASRARWLASLKTLADLHAERVVAGHKKDVDAPDSPDVLAFMRGYLTDFETARRSATDAAGLRQAMLEKYGDLSVRMLLGAGAQAAFRKPDVPVAPAASGGRIHDVESLAWMQSASPGLELAIVDGSPQGDGEYVVAMRYKGGKMTPVHSHPEEMRLVVVSGRFYVGFGERADSTGNKPLNPGSVVVMPKGSHHFEGATTDAVVLIYGKGPMRIDLVGNFH